MRWINLAAISAYTAAYAAATTSETVLASIGDPVATTWTSIGDAVYVDYTPEASATKVVTQSRGVPTGTAVPSADSDDASGDLAFNVVIPGQYSPFDVYAASLLVEWNQNALLVNGALAPSRYYSVASSQSHFRYFKFTEPVNVSDTVTVKLTGGPISAGEYTASFLVVANVTPLAKRAGSTFTLVVSTVISDTTTSSTELITSSIELSSEAAFTPSSEVATSTTEDEQTSETTTTSDPVVSTIAESTTTSEVATTTSDPTDSSTSQATTITTTSASLETSTTSEATTSSTSESAAPSSTQGSTESPSESVSPETSSALISTEGSSTAATIETSSSLVSSKASSSDSSALLSTSEDSTPASSDDEQPSVVSSENSSVSTSSDLLPSASISGDFSSTSETSVPTVISDNQSNEPVFKVIFPGKYTPGRSYASTDKSFKWASVEASVAVEGSDESKPIDFTLLSNEEYYKVFQVDSAYNANETVTFVVSADPTGAGEYVATFTIIAKEAIMAKREEAESFTITATATVTEETSSTEASTSTEALSTSTTTSLSNVMLTVTKCDSQSSCSAVETSGKIEEVIVTVSGSPVVSYTTVPCETSTPTTVTYICETLKEGKITSFVTSGIVCEVTTTNSKGETVIVETTKLVPSTTASPNEITYTVVKSKDITTTSVDAEGKKVTSVFATTETEFIKTVASATETESTKGPTIAHSYVTSEAGASSLPPTASAPGVSSIFEGSANGIAVPVFSLIALFFAFLV